MARTEKDMMKGMAAPEEPMAPEATATAPMDAPMAPSEGSATPNYDMETMMGNFMDMPQERRQIATRLLASPAVELFDEIIGEPAMSALREQLGNDIQIGGEETPVPAPEGMMSPSTAEPMADMPMEDEEATPPV